MARVIEFTGGVNPWDDIHTFVAMAKSKYPGITSEGINQLAMKTVMAYQARTNRVKTIYGRDILTADLEQIPAWQYLPDGEKARLEAHPYDGGTKLGAGNVAVAKAEQAGSLNRGGINREALVTPDLEQTYVFGAHTAIPWVQEVTENDYHTILSKADRRFFRDPDLHGPYVPVRSYDAYTVIERGSGNNVDLDHFVKENTRSQQWAGV